MDRVKAVERIIMTNTFPSNPARSLKVMMIAIDLQHIEHDSLFAKAVRDGAKARPAEAVRMVYDQAKDNYPMTCDIVGYKLVDKIIKVCEDI